MPPSQEAFAERLSCCRARTARFTGCAHEVGTTTPRMVNQKALGISLDIPESNGTEEALRISVERLPMAQWAAHILGPLILTLREASGEIHLVISDFGTGFDVQAAEQGKGPGLTSMRERVRLVGGTIAIDSNPMGGTTIPVRVPLES